MTATPKPQVDIEELENVIKQALPMTMRNESPCEARVALRALIAEVRALRAVKLRVHELASFRLLSDAPGSELAVAIERITR